MRKFILNTLTILLLIHVSIDIQAVPAYPYPVEVRQPDGTVLTLRLRGDEFHHFLQTVDGYPVSKDEDGTYCYATLDIKGHLVSTKIKANNRSKRNRSEVSFLSGLEINELSTGEIRQMS